MLNQRKHTLGEFDEALKSTRKSVLTMASLAQENLDNAINGLIARNEDLCNEAIAEDEEVNSFERSIDREGMELLMKFNPVASDLRLVLASMRISTNLERISDQAENIARRARKILRRGSVTEAYLVEPVYHFASEVVSTAVKSFAEKDTELALTLKPLDKKLDKLHRKAIKRYTQAMEEDTENLRTYLNLIFIVRCLERIGDHGVNIGEETVYINEGTDIRHIGPQALEDEEE